jgi:uncharacterized membrane protein HdeD (DUF308 family)
MPFPLETQTVGRSWWLILLFGIFAIVFGLVAIFDPVRAGAGMVWAIGIMAVAEGVLTLIAAFKKDAPMGKAWMLIYGAISLIFGVLAVINPVSMAASFVMVMGIWMVIAGVMRITLAIRVRKAIDNEWMLIVSGILAVVLGGLLLFMPVAGLILAVVWIGVGALVYGLLQIFAALRMRKLLAHSA